MKTHLLSRKHRLMQIHVQLCFGVVSLDCHLTLSPPSCLLHLTFGIKSGQRLSFWSANDCSFRTNHNKPRVPGQQHTTAHLANVAFFDFHANLAHP